MTQREKLLSHIGLHPDATDNAIIDWMRDNYKYINYYYIDDINIKHKILDEPGWTEREFIIELKVNDDEIFHYCNCECGGGGDFEILQNFSI